MSWRRQLAARVPAPAAGAVKTLVDRAVHTRSRVSQASGAGSLVRMTVRTGRLERAVAENDVLLPGLEARVAELEHEVAGVAERWLAARQEP